MARLIKELEAEQKKSNAVTNQKPIQAVNQPTQQLTSGQQNLQPTSQNELIDLRNTVKKLTE